MSRWQKGQSGNPAGKPKGSPDKRRLLRIKIEGYADELIELAVTQARTGDSTALALLLSRAVAPVRPEAATVTFQQPDSTKPSDWARAVLGAIAEGRLAPDTGRQLIDAINATQNIILIDEIAKRVQALEGGSNDD